MKEKEKIPWQDYLFGSIHWIVLIGVIALMIWLDHTFDLVDTPTYPENFDYKNYGEVDPDVTIYQQYGGR